MMAVDDKAVLGMPYYGAVQSVGTVEPQPGFLLPTSPWAGCEGLRLI